jgi:hypothetical protein
MGYCVSEADIIDLPAGEVNLEERRESFVLATERESLELEYQDIPRLLRLIEWMEKNPDDRR